MKPKLTHPRAKMPKKMVFLGWLILAFILIASPSIAQALDAQLQLGASHKVTITPHSENLDHFKDQNFKGSFVKLSVHSGLPIPSPLFDIDIGLAGSYESYDIHQTFTGFELKQAPTQLCSNVLSCMNQYADSAPLIINRFMATDDNDDSQDQPTSSLTGELTTLKGYSVGPQVMISASIPGISAGPYIRGQYVIARFNLASTISQDDHTSHLNIPIVGKGLRYAIGAHFSPIPILAFFVEHEWSNDNLGLSSVIKQVANTIEGHTSYKLSDKFRIQDLSFNLKRRSITVGIKAGI